ncbi:MAG TPA: hypothetical protein VJ785_18580 [Anaerolineales bacterium]|nr:hypothetical protein [Anaerolineales bacterium]
MQILLSGNTRELVQDSLPQATDLLDLGERRLKNNLHPEHLYQVALPFLMGKPNPQPRSSRIRTDLIKKFVKSV